MASASSHRQTVRPLIEATMPRRTASGQFLATESRERQPHLARQFTRQSLDSTTTSGGKKIRPTPARTALQTAQPLLAETLPPFADESAEASPNARRFRCFPGPRPPTGRPSPGRHRNTVTYIYGPPPANTVLLVRENNIKRAFTCIACLPSGDTLPPRDKKRNKIRSSYLCRPVLRSCGSRRYFK